MNAGIIVGTVRDRSRNKVGGAQVWMADLFGGAGGRMMPTGENEVRPGSPITEADSDGYFELVFAWSGTDIAHPIGGGHTVRISIAGMETVWQTKSSNITYLSRPQPIIGYMFKDIFNMMGFTPPDLKSVGGLLEFSKDILDAVANLKSHPLFKVSMLTSESYLILSAANLVINRY